MIRFYTLILLIVLPFVSLAKQKEKDDLDLHLEKFLKKYNSHSNVTKPQIYNGQRAGYATGGGIIIRNRANTTQPMTNKPSQSGCRLWRHRYLRGRL